MNFRSQKKIFSRNFYDFFGFSPVDSRILGNIGRHCRVSAAASGRVAVPIFMSQLHPSLSSNRFTAS